MESYQFYKSIYDRELNRRKDLDASINLPLTILTILVASNSYILKQVCSIQSLNQLRIEHIIYSFIILSFVISIFFLTRSYNNLFKGFAYRNLGLTSAIRKYEKEDLPSYNIDLEEADKIKFEDVVTDRLTTIIDNHIVFNDKRSHDLYIAKTFIIIGMILTALNFLIITIKNLKL